MVEAKEGVGAGASLLYGILRSGLIFFELLSQKLKDFFIPFNGNYTKGISKEEGMVLPKGGELNQGTG